MSNDLLSIIIVSWNVCDFLRPCLQSIFDHTNGLNVDVIVVDSASDDDTVSMVTSEFPDVTVLAQSENVGFPRGNNIGIAAAKSDLILLLNPDTVVTDHALFDMVAYMLSHPHVGIVGPQLLNSDGTHQSSRRRFPTIATLFFESTWLQSYAPTYVLADYYMWDTVDYLTLDVDWVSGAAMLTRRRVIDQVGGMDEAYQMYSEELDWCRRIKAIGWHVTYLPVANIIHHVGKSSRQVVTYRHIHFNRAKLRYARKYHGQLISHLLRAMLLISYLCQLLIELAKGIVGHKRPLRWQRVRSYAAVLKNGLKPAG